MAQLQQAAAAQANIADTVMPDGGGSRPNEDTAPNLPDTTDKETADCLADVDADGKLARVDGARARADPEGSPLARVQAQPAQVPAAPRAGFTILTLSNRVPIQGPRAVDSPASESADSPSQSAPMDPDAYNVEGGNREEAQGTGRTSTDSSHDDVQKKKEQQIHGEPFFTSPAEFARRTGQYEPPLATLAHRSASGTAV